MVNKRPDAAAIQSWCVNYVARILDADPAAINPNVEVDRVGLDSSTAVALILSLEEWLGLELMPEMLFDYPTIAGLSKHLASRAAQAAQDGEA
jgi:acyl carrier protein